MKNISVNNGNTYCTVKEALEKHSLDVMLNYMEDEACEQVHNELAPCSDEKYLTRYLEIAKNDLIIG